METEKRCEVHGTVLEPTKAGVSYGLPLRDEKLIEARNKLFPNSKRTMLGGCVAGSMGSRIEVLVCQDCRKAEDDWREQNDRKRQRIGDIKI